MPCSFSNYLLKEVRCYRCRAQTATPLFPQLQQRLSMSCTATPCTEGDVAGTIMMAAPLLLVHLVLLCATKKKLAAAAQVLWAAFKDAASPPAVATILHEICFEEAYKGARKD